MERKKLIEVALPLEAINVEAAREKSIRHGHPSTLHLWWARRPLAAARAVIFAQMVDDPGSVPEEFPTKEAQNAERQRLFEIISEMVKWENTTNETLLDQARAEIRRSWARQFGKGKHSDKEIEEMMKSGDIPPLPPFHDPFAGGGTLPLEAQRLGLEAHASDLNPVAVVINKAMIEIPPKFAGRAPIGPEIKEKKPKSKKLQEDWSGAKGLAEDVRRYGAWMRQEAEKRIGWLYPKIKITNDMVKDRPDLKPLLNRELTVIACLWARTVESPNPAYRGCHIPLISSYWLSTKKGKEAWVKPVTDGKKYRFSVQVGKPNDEAATDAGTKLSRGANFQCVLSASPISPEYIKAEGMAGRMGATLMAIVAEGEKSRVYLSPNEEMETVARKARPTWIPEQPLPDDPRNFWTVSYGLIKFSHLFTQRQLVALTTFSDLVAEAREKILADAQKADFPKDSKPLRDGGLGPLAYADAVSVYLGLGLDRLADRCSTICGWDVGYTKIRNTFGRQAIPMTWDFAEGNPFSDSTGNWEAMVEWVWKVLLNIPGQGTGLVTQKDATTAQTKNNWILSTDPPYYDNIGYADLSDFFYVWLRKSLQTVFPELFGTLLVPKAEELVATPYRHGGRENAEKFFLTGMTKAIHQMAEATHPAYPVTIYYAFKQAESNHDGVSSTGWETFLEAVIQAGFSLTGTWPMRTELGNRMIGSGTNALASSIVLVCRPRNIEAQTITRRDFLSALKRELPTALRNLQAGNIAPVDLAQASIGPGMAIFSRYAKILEPDGNQMRVRTALGLINQTLDEVLSEQEGDFDPDTGWAVAWFDQFGFNDGPFGEAETLCKAKNTSVNGLVEAGVATAKAGKVRLLRIEELPADWDPGTDKRLTIWEITHHLIRLLNAGETAAADLAAKLGAKAESARELAYRLYNVCERRKRATEAGAYNSLVQSWGEITRLYREKQSKKTDQAPALPENKTPKQGKFL